MNIIFYFESILNSFVTKYQPIQSLIDFIMFYSSLHNTAYIAHPSLHQHYSFPLIVSYNILCANYFDCYHLILPTSAV